MLLLKWYAILVGWYAKQVDEKKDKFSKHHIIQE